MDPPESQCLIPALHTTNCSVIQDKAPLWDMHRAFGRNRTASIEQTGRI